MNSNQKYITIIAGLFLLGTALFVWHEDLQTMLANVQVEAEPVEISGTWEVKNNPHQVHIKGVEIGTPETHFEGPAEVVQRIGDWRFEFKEIPGHLLEGKAFWTVAYADGTYRHEGQGHLSGVVMDEHWIGQEKHLVFTLEVPAHTGHFGGVRPAGAIRYSLRMQEGRLVGYALSGIGGMFASAVILEKVSSDE